jgi:YfiR/HmsC-like
MENRSHIPDNRADSKKHRKARHDSCRGRIIFFLLSIFLVHLVPAFAQTAEVSQVKAAYLYNFTKYVEWPPDAFRSADDPAVICVIGDDRTGKILEQVTLGKKANGRRVEARNPRSVNEFRACQVLFIGFADKDRIAGILRNLRDSNVLVVGQTGEFLSLGGMINLVQRNGAIELEIDTKATNAAGLKVSSRLLVVSRIVSDERPAGVPR